ncbi:hypothetical protein SDC9_58860 [bioreactor metagenome]|uniref:Uncharacterized protein n=1 Tax=bioreactor metagenome TaxID=1076179 RepID=A0A644X9B6_9ZZZZ
MIISICTSLAQIFREYKHRNLPEELFGRFLYIFLNKAAGSDAIIEKSARFYFIQPKNPVSSPSSSVPAAQSICAASARVMG